MPPSKLPKLYWQNTFDDLQTFLRIKVGHQQAMVMQDFQTLASIVSKAFGSSKPKPKAVSSNQELEAAFSSMFGPGAVR